MRFSISLMVMSPLSSKCFIDDRQLLDPMLVQHLASLFQAGPFGRRDQLVALHDLRDLQIHPGFEPQIAIRENTDQLLVFGNGNPGDSVFRHQRMGIANRLIGRDRDWVENHAALRFLDPVHFSRLIHRRQDAVNNPDAAFAGDGDGQPRLGDGIHGRADDGNVDLDVASQSRTHVDFTRQDLRFGRNQHDIVIGQPQTWFLIEHVFSVIIKS